VGNGARVGNQAAFICVEVLVVEGEGCPSLHERHRDGDEWPATISGSVILKRNVITKKKAKT